MDDPAEVVRALRKGGEQVYGRGSGCLFVGARTGAGTSVGPRGGPVSPDLTLKLLSQRTVTRLSATRIRSGIKGKERLFRRREQGGIPSIRRGKDEGKGKKVRPPT